MIAKHDLLKEIRSKYPQNIDTFTHVNSFLFYKVKSISEDPQKAEKFSKKVEKWGGKIYVDMLDLTLYNVIKIHRFPCTVCYNKIVVEVIKDFIIYPGFLYYLKISTVGVPEKADSAIDYSNLDPWLSVSSWIKHNKHTNPQVCFGFANNNIDSIVVIDKGQVLICVTIPDE